MIVHILGTGARLKQDQIPPSLEYLLTRGPLLLRHRDCTKLVEGDPRATTYNFKEYSRGSPPMGRPRYCVDLWEP